MTDKSCIAVAMALLTALSPSAYADETARETEDRAAIEAFTREFLHAFEDLDMKQFIACFADDATVFFRCRNRLNVFKANKQSSNVSSTSSLQYAARRSRVRHFTISRLRILQFNWCPGRTPLSHSSSEMQSGSRVELLCLRR